MIATLLLAAQWALEPIAEKVEQPIQVVCAPNTKLLYVVQRHGFIRQLLDDGTLAETPLLDIQAETTTSSERGLLSMAFAPDWPNDARFFINYTNRKGNTCVDEFQATLKPSPIADMKRRRQLLLIQQPWSNHNGGCIAFGPDGLLYVGMGDGGSANDPLDAGQDDSVLLGKMLRLNIQAESPKPEIYAKGLRNPWRFSFDSQTGDLWIGDVGQNAWEEINFLPAGKTPGANFGWNIREGRHPFSTEAKEDVQAITCTPFHEPVFEYAQTALRRSVTGGVIYHGSKHLEFQGHYFFGDFVSGDIWSLSLHGKTHKAILHKELNLPGVVDFSLDSQGELVITSLYGSISRLVSRNNTRPGTRLTN